MKVLFAFENPLPSPEADAEVFVTTARNLVPRITQSWLHVPAVDGAHGEALSADLGIPVIRAWAPIRPAALRHLLCGLTLVLRHEFREADLIYTRNLWVAWMSILFGQRVAFDHYRPWPAQIPPLQFWIYRLLSHPRFLVHICHSEYTRRVYIDLGVAPEKLICIRNGFDPGRLEPRMDAATAKRMIGIDSASRTVVYTGRINHKKGLALVIEAARRLPDVLFVLVGSRGDGPIERLARDLPNVRIVGWQSADTIGRYIFAADVLLIPPSSQPLATFGSTVLPLKLYLYMASGRPIIAGDTPDVREVLRHGETAVLCRPDDHKALAEAITTLLADDVYSARLATAAQTQSLGMTWTARGERIAQLLSTCLNASGVARVRWGEAHRRNWVVQSRRWFMHLLRRRAWVLPPAADLND